MFDSSAWRLTKNGGQHRPPISFNPWRWLYPHTQRRMLRPVTSYPFPSTAQGVADIVVAGG